MNAAGIIFSNIYDSELSELTKLRTVASLPFAGRYRLIDFVLSNMSNSGIRKIGIITKYNYQSLMDHLGSGQEWDLNLKENDVKVLPPFAIGHNGVYQGKLEALANSMDFLTHIDADYIVLSDSVCTCTIDYEDVVRKHEESGKDVTIVLKKYKGEHEHKFPVAVTLKEDGAIDELGVDVTDNDCYGGMGMYVFNREKLIHVIKASVVRGHYHLERDYLQRFFNNGKLTLNPYLFNGEVLFNFTTLDYYRNSMKLLEEKVYAELFRKPNLPIYTRVRDSVPTYYGKDSMVSNSMLADGCSISGTVESSILFRDVQVAKTAVVRECVIMEGARIGEGAVLENMILDKNVEIRPYTVLKGSAEHPLIIEKGAKV